MTAYGHDPFCEISGELVVIHDTSLRVSTGCLDPDDNEAPVFCVRAVLLLGWPGIGPDYCYTERSESKACPYALGAVKRSG